MAGSWYTLLSILEEARDIDRDERTREPECCELCCTPLKEGPHGGLFCPFDGWQPS